MNRISQNKVTPLFCRLVSGQSLAEYGLAIGVVAIVCIGALAALGGNIQTGMSGVFDLMGSKPPSGNPQVQNLAQTVGIGGIIPPPGAGEAQLCFQSGFCINVPSVAQGATVSDTTGGLGGDLTAQFADVFEQIADQLELAGQDPTFVDKVRLLAQSGHGLGNAENALPKGDDCDNLDRSVCDNFFDTSNVFVQSFSDLKQYMQANSDKIPADVQAILHFQGEEINNIRIGIDIGPKENTIGLPIPETNAAQLTHQSANVICQGGNGGPTCIQ